MQGAGQRGQGLRKRSMDRGFVFFEGRITSARVNPARMFACIAANRFCAAQRDLGPRDAADAKALPARVLMR